jgi:rRNA-processing protein FCF1
MNDYLLDLLTKYRNKGILVDTNLLLLFIVGSLDPGLIPRISRTASYSVQDFQIVAKVIDFFDTKVTTPHVLTEVSNLIDRIEVQRTLRSFVSIVVEKFVESSKIVTHNMFEKFGLADTAILDVSKDNYLVLTNDGPLIGFLSNNDVDVLSLELLRAMTSKGTDSLKPPFL